MNPRAPVKRSILSSSEMIVFWALTPFLAGAFVIAGMKLEAPFSWALEALLATIAAFALLISLRGARLGAQTTVERNELRSIIGSLEDALVAYDEEFRILFFNPAAEKLFRLDAAAVVGRAMRPQDAGAGEFRLFAQVLFPSLAPQLSTRSKPGRYPQVVDISVQNPALELRVATSPITNEKGDLVGFMKLVRDRTREVAILRSKDEFVSVASHQLRTPITELNWALETLASEKGLSENAHSLLGSARSSAGSLLRIVDDLLNISKVEEGTGGYEFKPIDIAEFVGDVLTAAKQQTDRAGLKLYFDQPEAPLPRVLADEGKLKMALTNLLDNATRYNIKNGEITVSVKKADGPFVRISVKDTGIGIPESEAANLFGKFFRGTNAVKFQTEGSGLGLYIVKTIVEAHGGEASVESELNRGTTISFTLPLGIPEESEK